MINLKNRFKILSLLILGLLLTACQTPTPQPPLPTLASLANTPTPTSPATKTTTNTANVPPTWTPNANNQTTPTTNNNWTPIPSRTAQPTNTPINTVTPRPPTSTPTLTPTATLPPTITPTPSATPIPFTSGNLLPNPSFENGWYHPQAVPELQVPNGWLFAFEEGNNPLDPDAFNRFVRPETRILNTDFLPAAEHSTFIWDGTHTFKVFKGQGALNFRLYTDITLEAGSYRFRINAYPDIIQGYSPGGDKVFAVDPLAGEIRFIVGDAGTGWQYPTFGQRDTWDYYFTLPTEQTISLGIAARNRWAVDNNGWFFDAWELRQIAPTPTPTLITPP